MKINISYPSDGFVNEDFILLKYALEQDNNFEALVWRLRGLFGIPVSDLDSQSDIVQEIYKEALDEKPELHPKDEYEIPENATESKLDEFFKKNPDIAIRIQDDNEWRNEVARLSAIELLKDYKLPMVWVEPLVQFVFINRIYMPNSVSPINLRLSEDTTRRIISSDKLNEDKQKKLLAHTNEPEGLLLNISARIQPDTLGKWAKKNWNEIEELMDLVNLPEDTHSQVQQHKRMRRAYEILTINQERYGKYDRKVQDTSLKEFMNEFPNLTSDYAKFNKDASRYRNYIRDCANSLKV